MSLVSFSQAWRKQLSKKAARADSLYDQARFVAVSTGRLEPLLRYLAQHEVYFGSETTQSLVAWSSRQRAIFSHPEYAPSFWIGRTVASLAGSDHFLVIDPNTASEITVEAKHFATVARLASGIPCEEALTAIGAESLSAGSLSPADQSFLQQENTRLTNGFHWRGCQVSLVGFGDFAFPVAFLFNQDQQIVTPRSTLSTAEWKPPTADGNTGFGHNRNAQFTGESVLSAPDLTDWPKHWIVVDPQTADWRRDLLWDFRMYVS